jgi:hypothetical protein
VKSDSLLRNGFAAIWICAAVLSFYKAIPLLVAAPSTINPAAAKSFGGCLLVFIVAWFAHMHLFLKAKNETEK